MLRRVVLLILTPFLLIFSWLLLARIVRHFHKFPMPEFLADFIMPFDDKSFDVIYMIAVIGEIPEPDRALAECRRVLKPEGTLAISEIMLDPDSKRPSTLRREVEATGFHYKDQVGNLLVYSMLFYKQPA